MNNIKYRILHIPSGEFADVYSIPIMFTEEFKDDLFSQLLGCACLLLPDVLCNDRHCKDCPWTNGGKKNTKINEIEYDVEEFKDAL